MKRLNNMVLGLVVIIAFCLSATSIYAADKAAAAKPQPAQVLTKSIPAEKVQLNTVQLKKEIRPGNAAVPRRDPGEGDPIEINDIEELQRIGNDENYPLNGVYILANDIDASEARDWNDGAGFDPIGDRNHPFTGTFDGNGHIISGLFINRPEEDYIGLFGRTNDGAVIENIGLVEVEISASDKVGGLVGYSYNTTISNSYITGSVSGHGNRVGGLIGANYLSSITASYVSASVSGNQFVGGLSGSAGESRISNSYVTGSVNGQEQVGGLVGVNSGSSISDSYSDSYTTGNVNGLYNCVGGLVGRNIDSPISNSYATGRVECNGQNGQYVYVGGLVGKNEHSAITNSYATGNVSASFDSGVGGLVGYNWDNSTISNSYATGSVNGQGSIGGLVGTNSHSSTILNSYAIGRVVSDGEVVGGLVGYSNNVPAQNYRHNYWDTETTGRDNGIGNMDEIDGVQGRTTAELMEQDTFEDWNFEENWFMPGQGEDELTFPHLRMETAVHHHSFIAQDIELSVGWNMISFNTQPDIRDLSYIFRNVENLILVKDESGNFFSPQRNFDNLPELSLEEGYQVKVSEPSQLHIFGKAPQLPFKIPLRQGWNIMGYPVSQAQPAMNVLQQLVDAGITFIVKNSAGKFIMHFNNRDFNNLGDFQPGQGYQILVDRDVDLVIGTP